MKKDRITACIKHGEEQFAAQPTADKQKQNQFIVKTKIEVLQQVLVDYNNYIPTVGKRKITEWLDRLVEFYEDRYIRSAK
jgi:hypothetical protein